MNTGNDVLDVVLAVLWVIGAFWALAYAVLS